MQYIVVPVKLGLLKRWISGQYIVVPFKTLIIKTLNFWQYIMVPCKMCNAGNFEDAMETLGMVRLGNSTTQFNFLLYRNAKLTEPINVDFPTVFSFN